jgi:ParB family chromosome partitioning protein
MIKMSKNEENVVQIPLNKLQTFPEHPFRVRDDQLMQQLVESIRNVGVLVPAIVRRTDDGFFELIGGHRRKHACEILGMSNSNESG